jgi:glycosyltransferase involved in cell wall biosynthesis
MDLSYIICHKGNLPERIKNLEVVLEWLTNFDIEVIVVEEDDSPKSKDMIQSKNYKYVFVENKGVFNRSWGFNVGVKHSTRNIVVCADNDMIISRELFNICYKRCQEGLHAVSPFVNVIDLTEEETNNFIKAINEDRSKVLSDPVQRTNFRNGIMNLCSGIVFFRKDGLKEIGMWEEIFRGWGGEDNAMSIKFQKLRKPTEILKGKCFHLFHNRTTYDTNKHELYRLNKSRLHEMANMNIGQLGIHIQNNLKDFGYEEKYKNEEV